MGWIAIFALAALVYVALWKSGRCSRLALEISGAALLLGIAGYAWQGKPDMPGNPVSQSPR
jgi:cytochrome c-type biogenesis protein CcmH